MTKLLIIPFYLLTISFSSCRSYEDEKSKDFVRSVFILEQGSRDGKNIYYPGLNEGIDESVQFHDFFFYNDKMMSYLLWNLIDLRLPATIKKINRRT